MLQIGFSGWFQCRLATDPDPYDERRGVSGYVRAYVDEPDLDRVVRFQAPPFVRALSPEVSVRVDTVVLNGAPLAGTAFAGAKVDLLGSPVFEGRNGVVSEDGLEPVFPFDLSIEGDGVSLRRAVVPADPSYPFEGLLAPGVDISRAEEISQATGIASLAEVWRQRRDSLQAMLATAVEPQRTAIGERLAFLNENLARRGGGTARFFGAAMVYDYALGSPDPVAIGLDKLGFDPEMRGEWRVSFWLGGWDADVLCGFCLGRLSVPDRAQPLPLGRPAAPDPSVLRRRDRI